MSPRRWDPAQYRYVECSEMDDIAAAEADNKRAPVGSTAAAEATLARCNRHFGAFQTICLDAMWCGLGYDCERVWRRELVIYAARLALKQMRGR